MGYTHYWRGGATEIPAAALQIIRPLLAEAHAAGLIQLDFHDPAPPHAGPSGVFFNGVGSEGHETFFFPAPGSVNVWGGNFCKTNRKPYDIVVQRVLLTLAYHLPNISIQSDGDFTGEDWREAREWAEQQGMTLHYHEKAAWGPGKQAARDAYHAKQREAAAPLN